MAGYGIGAAGVAGVSFEVMPPPVATSATPAAGGALTAGVYKYYITAINAVGETTVSNELTGTTSAGNLTLVLLWAAVANATGYKIYRTAAGGGTGTELLLATVGAVLTYNDAAVGAPAGAFPTSNSAFDPGTYTAPAKYFPLNNETLKYQQANVSRRPIRKSTGVIGVIPGTSHVAGDIEVEVTDDILPWFLYAAQTLIVKSGTPPNYIYTVTPAANAIPPRTLSITIDRDNGVIFAYTGCVVSAIKLSIVNGELIASLSIVGIDETTQAAITPTYNTTTPFGAGMYSIEFPTGTPVLDTDTFEYTCDDQATPEPRLKSTTRAVQFVRFAERNCTLRAERDFTAKTDYDAFKAVTSQSVTLTATKGANNSVSILLPVAIKDTYEVNLSSPGALVRGVIQYVCTIDNTGKDYQYVIKTQENIN
jgi:hypothetical protein